MGEAVLVEGQIADAIALVQKLDARGDAPTLAAWYLYDDANEWRLLIAGPIFDAALQRQEPIAYQKIVEALIEAKPTSLAISDIKLIGSRAALPSAIRMMIGTDPNGIARAHCSANTINGIFIKEMIVIRSA